MTHSKNVTAIPGSWCYTLRKPHWSSSWKSLRFHPQAQTLRIHRQCSTLAHQKMPHKSDQGVSGLSSVGHSLPSRSSQRPWGSTCLQRRWNFVYVLLHDTSSYPIHSNPRWRWTCRADQFDVVRSTTWNFRFLYTLENTPFRDDHGYHTWRRPRFNWSCLNFDVFRMYPSLSSWNKCTPNLQCSCF